MKKNITVNFKDIVAVLEKNNLKICFLKRRGIFIEDEQKNLYQMENRHTGSYLDKLIKNAVEVTFYLVNPSISQCIEDWEREVWDVTQVKSFIKRHSLH
ncbi:hypothetical protein [Lacrimispora indolis]|uniref:hypothetical protein n=1 Tax=Lacrimispora indolis TaxID=69825 RepID=UPI000462C6FA|nr:hypothetical protein [[Clostridium] methoxybenzovorans]